MNNNIEKQKKILVYRLGSLGDTIIVLPCFHKIKEVFPNHDITLLTNRPVAAKAAPVESIIGKSFFTRQLYYPVGTRNIFVILRLIWNIRKLKIYTLINVTAARSEKAAKRDKWFFKLAGVKKMIGFPEKPEDFRLVEDKKTGQYEWEALRLARRIETLGNLNLKEEHYWDLLLTKEENIRAKELIGEVNKNILAISPGTKVQAKDWGKNNWIELLSHLGKEFQDFKLLIIGATDERDMGENFGKAWGKDFINLCGSASPRESAAVLKYAKIFIGHDSGPTHLAAAVSVPCVAIFAARNLPGHWYPRGENNSILYHKTDCAGCGLDICTVENKKCIMSITVSEVYNSIRKILYADFKEALPGSFLNR